MKSNALLFLVVLSCLYLTLAQGSYEDCCLKYVKKIRPGTRRHVIDYRVQRPDGGCNINAIVFTMKRGRLFCADPKQKWVQHLMDRIDELSLNKSLRG